jgi:hypothetical protein
MSLSAKLVPTSGCLFGGYAANSCDTTSTDFEVLFRNHETQVQRTAATNLLNIVHAYRDFPAYTSGVFPSVKESNLAGEGRLLLINWTPKIFNTTTIFRWPDITAGAYDATYLIPTAQAMAAWGQKFFLAFHTEMNASSSDQGASPAYGTDAEYAAAAQHVHDVFLAQGASNVVWVFNPAGHSSTISRTSALYPGDQYVDWLGYDPYGNSGESADSVISTKYPMYNWATVTKSGSHTMPMMWCEWGDTESATGTSKASFFTSLATLLPSTYPLIKAITYFNSTSSTGDCVSTSSAALDAYRGLAATPYFNPDVSPTPSPPSGTIAHRAAAGVTFVNSASKQITFPSTAQAGDGALLFHACTRTGLRNAGEGTNAASVTVGNSGSAGSNPVDSVTGTAPTYDTSQKHSGASSMHASLTSGTDCHADWVASFPWPTAPHTSYWGRTYFRRPSSPSAIARIYEQNSAANALQWALGFDTAGKIIVRDTSAGITRATQAGTAPAVNTQHRAEWQATWDGSKTTVTVRLFLGANVDATIPDETITSTAFTQAAAPGRGKFGLLFSAANTYDVYHDDWGLDANTWLGPSGTSAVLTAPAGWVPVDSRLLASGAAELVSRLYRKPVAAGDSGSTLTLVTDLNAHGSILLVTYSGADQLALVDVEASSTKTADAATIVTPSVGVTGAGEWLISAGFVRDNPGAATTSWTLPGGEVQRAVTFPSGAADGRVAGVVSDDAATHGAGATSTRTFTSNVTSYLGIGWTVALLPGVTGGAGQYVGVLVHQL